ncbi:SidA/IucD/PvdA family monooxygenase [Arthrobacter sp. TMN-37]
MDVRPVVIIGAGPAGLSVAAALTSRGIIAAVLDRSEAVASSWRHRPERLRLNSGRRMSQFPGTTFPRHARLFPTRHVVAATGLYGSPLLPQWPGLELVADRLIHSYDYIGPEPFNGEHVLVIGSGTSGFEISGELGTAHVLALPRGARYR